METKFNFKSQVCTDKNQSERLLALGLKKETADMAWWSHTIDWCGIVNDDKRQWHLSLHYVEPKDARMETIPAWSLHRLLCLYGQDYEIKELYNSAEECYGMLITAIGRAIENEEFNEEYLNNGVYTH